MPHVTVDELVTVMVLYPMTPRRLVGTSAEPFITTEVPPVVV